jgi:serine phosphatase RsbU (regulator of sigma subunit)
MLSAWGGQNSIVRNSDNSFKKPDEVIAELNREFLIQKNNFQYFTMIYGLLDSKENSLSYCRAGHTPLILQNTEGEIFVKEEGSIPVGLNENGSYKEFKIYLKPGDRIIVYSDGITEARLNKEFFGEKRFYDLLRESRDLPVKEAVDYIVNRVKAWMQQQSPADDVSLMIIETDH